MLKSFEIKLITSNNNKNILNKTFMEFNSACNYISEYAFNNKIYDKYFLQTFIYSDLRDNFNLSAQLTVRAIDNVCKSYIIDKKVMHIFNEYSALVEDNRSLNFKNNNIVSISALNGRIKLNYISRRKNKINNKREDINIPHNRNNEYYIIKRKNDFYIEIPYNTENKEIKDPLNVIGVDLGIVNVAVDSTGRKYTGNKIKKVRNRYKNLRSKLQRAGTKSAKRHLRKLSKKESRFQKDTDHIISKEIVSKAEGTSSILVMEDLTNIGKKTVVNKKYRYMHNSWSFYQLKSFILYKAQEKGITVVFINPAYTSQECPVCHYINKNNRYNRDNFKCLKCGYKNEADYVASLNIKNRVAVNLPIVAGIIYDRLICPAASSHALA